MNPDLQAKIERGAKLAREVSQLEAKKAELEKLKKEFREIAGKNYLRLEAPGGAFVEVEPKEPTTARVVPNESLAKVVKLAGDHIFNLFTLHPSKGAAANFELNLRQTLPKTAADRLATLLSVPATSWVKFRG